jgi:hypothetical protein
VLERNLTTIDKQQVPEDTWLTGELDVDALPV